jgi:DNA-directed RNA polymerase specialized sigma subunit
MKVEGDYTCDICGESFDRNVDIASHMRAHQMSISAETIIDELQRLAEEMGRPPKESELADEAEFTEGAVSSTFGSWSEGLEAAGLEPRTNGYTDTEVLEELQRVAAQIGHSPSRNEWQEHGEISAKTVRAHFGSWNEGLRAASLETTPQQTATEEDVLEAIQNLATKLGRPPTAQEMEQRGEWSVKVAQRRFGTWNTALREAGFEPLSKKDVPEDELVAELARLRNELGHVPSSTEMHEHGQFTLYLYVDRYGSWKQAVEAAGMEYRGYPSGQDHHLWKGGYGDISYGPNWYRQRKRALERDGFECQMPGCPIDRETHRERWDRDLNVHHITPLGAFIDADGVLDYERSNRLENLITLCQRHHTIWEEFAPLQPDIR